jgi:hypothetical protein
VQLLIIRAQLVKRETYDSFNGNEIDEPERSPESLNCPSKLMYVNSKSHYSFVTS